jgi:hypothetical protein
LFRRLCKNQKIHTVKTLVKFKCKLQDDPEIKVGVDLKYKYGFAYIFYVASSSVAF